MKICEQFTPNDPLRKELVQCIRFVRDDHPEWAV